MRDECRKVGPLCGWAFEVMKKQSTGLIAEILRYLRIIALIVLAITAVAAASFVFTGGFSPQAFSDRMFWAGVICMIIGGFGVLSMMNLNHNVLGLPNVVIKKEDARKLIDNNLELREAIDKRYDFSIFFWSIGMVCIAIGALATIVGGWNGLK